jgi:unsaturated rhamnogalacturonyl hydrolase
VLYDDVVNQFLVVDKYTVDKKTGLNFQAWDVSHRELWANRLTGQSQNFWSVGIAMYLVALVETLEYLPVNHPDRAVKISIFRRVCGSAMKFQDRKTGLWHQVTNMKRKKDNFLESSSTAMFSFAIAKGINKGYIDLKYRKNAEKAFAGLLKYSTEINADSAISFLNASSQASLGGIPYSNGSYFYYVGLPTIKNDPKLIGHLILTAIELEKMKW